MRPKSAMIGNSSKASGLCSQVMATYRDLRDVVLADVARELRSEAQQRSRGKKRVIWSYAAAMEALRQTIGVELYPVQIRAALFLRKRCCVEMQTGEGKTFTSVPAIAYYAMMDKGCHVVTANDYLVQRDSDELRPVFESLGLTVGAVLSNTTTDARRVAYRQSITYSTATQFGFDFLKDQLSSVASGVSSVKDTIQRSRFAVLVDEADYTLIDEARTPLVLATERNQTSNDLARWEWANRLAVRLPDELFVLKPHRKTAVLTGRGCKRVLLEGALGRTDGLEQLYRAVETAKQAHLFYLRDRNYLVENGEVQLIDERTGRRLPGRRWQLGIHQAIEVKEGLPVSTENADAARISIQKLFSGYRHLAGMTGTTHASKAEFRKLFKVGVRAVATHRPSKRKECRKSVWPTRKEKWDFVVSRVTELNSLGRPVLIGTVSVEASEQLSQVLTRARLRHSLLNARQDKEEADIVSNAGTERAITIATGMAGRGTDIPLKDTACQAGGLHVIATEVSASRRVDRQLIGRCARQGDPGSFEFIVSLEDDLLTYCSPRQRRQLHRLRLSTQQGQELAFRQMKRLQRQIERRHRKARLQLKKTETESSEQAERHGLNEFVEFLRP